MNTNVSVAPSSADYNSAIGALLTVDCKLTSPVSVQDLIGAMHSNPNIPREWIPAPKSAITLFHDAVGRFTHIQGKGIFDIDPSVCGFTPEQHHSYMAVRLVKDRQAQDPVVYKILHVERVRVKKEPQVDISEMIAAIGKTDGAVDNLKNALNSLQSENDAKVHPGITFKLSRVSGTPDDDAKGLSRFQIFADAEGSEDCVERYQPFIDAVTAHYNELMMHVYGNKQFNDLIKGIIRDKLCAAPFSGWYFSVQNKYELIKELQKTINSLTPQISFIAMPVFPASPETPQEYAEITKHVVTAVNEDLLNRVDALKENIDKSLSKSYNRGDTWTNRLDEIQRLRDEFNNYKSYAMTVDDLIAEALDQLEDRVEDLLNP